MQIVIKVLIGAMILVGAILALSSKQETNFLKSDRIPIKHTYYYYPKANFYYDSTDGNYICWDSASAAWSNTDKLPVQQADLGKTVRIGETSEPVWIENQHHRLIYSVSLYSGPKDFKIEEKPEVAENEKSNIAIKPQKAEKKSGVRKFFERVFPPKKKNT